MNLSHKIQLDPTKEQRVFFAKACGVARRSWNWALDEWQKAVKRGEKPSGSVLKKRWNKIKDKLFPWVRETHRDAYARSFDNLQTAFNRFFKKISKFPTWKKKGHHDSFYVANDKISLDGKRIRIPKLGWVRLRESLRFDGRVLSATVSREADRWFVAVAVDVGDYTKPRSGDDAIGVDLGVSTFAVLSTGERIAAPNPLKKSLKRLQRLSRKHSRKKKGSNNRKKSAMRLARMHRRIKNIRNDFLHKTTTMLCSKAKSIVIEDLNVKGMMANRKLSRRIADQGFFEFRRQAEYKSKIYGTDVVVADRWFPSSKTCSSCGWKKDGLTLSEREFVCEACGLAMDRDHNAALNLLSRVGLTRIHACGDSSSGEMGYPSLGMGR